MVRQCLHWTALCYCQLGDEENVLIEHDCSIADVGVLILNANFVADGEWGTIVFLHMQHICNIQRNTQKSSMVDSKQLWIMHRELLIVCGVASLRSSEYRLGPLALT